MEVLSWETVDRNEILKTVLKTLFIVPTDAHSYKIIEMFKKLKL